jgi:hypothetical protein
LAERSTRTLQWLTVPLCLIFPSLAFISQRGLRPRAFPDYATSSFRSRITKKLEKKFITVLLRSEGSGAFSSTYPNEIACAAALAISSNVGEHSPKRKATNGFSNDDT